jgi:hypothetical protein
MKPQILRVSLCAMSRGSAVGIATGYHTVSYVFRWRSSGLVVRVLGYRSGGPASIPGTTRKKSSGSGTGSTQPRQYSWWATWKKSSGSCLEIGEYNRRDTSRWPRGTLYPQKLAITSPISGSRSVGVVRSRTQTMGFVVLFESVMLYIEGVYKTPCTQELYFKWKWILFCVYRIIVFCFISPGFTKDFFFILFLTCRRRTGFSPP